jgi:hypothetical protein
MKYKIFGITFLVLIGAIVVGAVYYWQYGGQKPLAVSTTFEQCIANPQAKMLETYPEQCALPNGLKFVDPTQPAPTPPQTPSPCPPGTVPIGMTQSMPGSYICGPAPKSRLK